MLCAKARAGALVAVTINVLKASQARRNIIAERTQNRKGAEGFSREVAAMATPQPGIGDWYRLNGGALFEVVALDDDDGTIEIQYFDGTVEEMDIEDWEAQWEEGALESAEAPEDWSGSVDVEGNDDEGRGGDSLPEDRDVRASSLDGIDLFE
ncbi:MAG TPA: DUF6763 family protein [Steroidobacteraceae bacterium]|nr:DUF6763 family protein [Steroidobacteraceae bacterium]